MVNPGNPLSTRALLPSFLGIAGLFLGAVWVTRTYETEILAVLTNYRDLALFIFLASTALAVILPFWSNLPLVPVAALLWGPLATTGLLIAGWVVGSVASFWFARAYQAWLLRRFPTFARYAFIDKLIVPTHPFLSLVILRMTFPVDILSYALGVFSRSVSARANALSTLVGITPFAFLFGYFTNMPERTQAWVLAASTLLFFVYLGYIARLRKIG